MNLTTPRIEQELAHLLSLAGPPFMPAWLAYAEWKARALETKYPNEFAGLPLMLSNSLKQLKESAKSG